MNLLLSLIIFFSTITLTTIKSFAVCPICIVAVGAGLGVSRYLGIDDTITGVWIGGLVIASAFWFADIIQKKKWKIPYPEALSTVSFLLLTIIPMYIKKIIGNPTNTLWGVDKIVLGIVAGLITFIISIYLDKSLRKTNHGEVYIYYQKVILPVLFLTLASFTFYLLT
ncbi:hypothetical protein GYA37_02160 [candidate division WWE3 bacterium]|uniref:Uncharacterized protein n=1 Tax=candidate division WWE3 bacterium TaxID=2053526 RepID=A0A7X9E6X3_UNCKA|nr:hypothetical protein [candidate division WWE3 bacterium]